MRPHSLICRTKFVLLHFAKKNSICYENTATVFFSQARPGTPTPRENFFRARIFFHPPPLILYVVFSIFAFAFTEGMFVVSLTSLLAQLMNKQTIHVGYFWVPMEHDITNALSLNRNEFSHSSAMSNVETPHLAWRYAGQLFLGTCPTITVMLRASSILRWGLGCNA